jgi:hypothetical protein
MSFLDYNELRILKGEFGNQTWNRRRVVFEIVFFCAFRKKIQEVE